MKPKVIKLGYKDFLALSNRIIPIDDITEVYFLPDTSTSKIHIHVSRSFDGSHYYYSYEGEEADGIKKFLLDTKEKGKLP